MSGKLLIQIRTDVNRRTGSHSVRSLLPNNRFAVNLQTAWLSPPVALLAYFLKGVVPEWDLKDIYYGMIQFMVIQMISLILIFIFPQIVLWPPVYIYGR